MLLYFSFKAIVWPVATPVYDVVSNVKIQIYFVRYYFKTLVVPL